MAVESTADLVSEDEAQLLFEALGNDGFVSASTKRMKGLKKRGWCARISKGRGGPKHSAYDPSWGLTHDGHIAAANLDGPQNIDIRLSREQLDALAEEANAAVESGGEYEGFWSRLWCLLHNTGVEQDRLKESRKPNA